MNRAIRCSSKSRRRCLKNDIGTHMVYVVHSIVQYLLFDIVSVLYDCLLQFSFRCKLSFVRRFSRQAKDKDQMTLSTHKMTIDSSALFRDNDTIDAKMQMQKNIPIKC